jgi:hypothetical protein
MTTGLAMPRYLAVTASGDIWLSNSVYNVAEGLTRCPQSMEESFLELSSKRSQTKGNWEYTDPQPRGAKLSRRYKFAEVSGAVTWGH